VLYVRDDNATLFKVTSPPRPAALAASPQLAQPTRRGLSKPALAAIGGIAAAVVAVVSIVLAIVIRSDHRPPPTPPAATSLSTASKTSPTVSASTPISDPATVFQKLNDVGVDTRLPKSVIVDYLNNEYTPYPPLGAALLQVLRDRGLRRPVEFEVIVGFYEHSPGNSSPRRLEDVNFTLLEASVVNAFNERYGQEVTDFESLLNPPR
jgi:hypothetical protein